MNLSTFAENLRQRMKGDESLRPFVCEGSPLDCRVLLVGANPATDMSPGFWPWWEDGYGFRKKKWFDDYKALRRQRMAQGERIREVSPTRSAIDAGLNACPAAVVLETNVFAKPSRSVAELRTADRAKDCFNLLASVVPYRLVILHGADAQDYFEREIGELEHGVVVVKPFRERDVAFYATRHLRLGSPKVRATELAQVLKSHGVTGPHEA